MLVVTAAAVGKGVLMVGSALKLGLGLAMAASLPAVRRESNVNFEETAQIATEAFSARGKVFTADQMRWLYNDSFSHGTTVLAAHADGRKVGQIALIHQNIQVRGQEEQAVLLTDLFILEKYRSRQVLVDLFAQVLESCQARGVRFILGMPNTSARSINDHFLKMIPYLKLDIRASWRLPLLGTGDIVSRQMKDVDHAEAIALFERFALAPDNAVEWTAEGLFSRLTGTQQDYAIHYNERLLAISTRRERKGVDFTLLCGLFPARDATPVAGDARRAMRAACDVQKARLGIYIGHDEVMPALPGIALPDRLRPSPMTLDLRDLVNPDDSVAFSRYQGVDFDFA
ncbi:GNAT family N-acetyltransferase [Devosia sp. FKR38]|uniref:GNAT family N-acetyltransferase n=1 Tax=Devosia sp. FKR38 TaxID=2562312 RepID=UPI0010BFBE0A|nr:GNAT family N-acetyltransferase [Devosia sp. FKR38]